MRFLKQVVVGAVALVVACGGETTNPPVPIVTTISVSLNPITISADQSAIATATGADQFGAAITLGTITWTTSDQSVATVSPGGFVTAVSPGTVQLIATVGTLSGRTSLVITPIPVATVIVAPTGVRIAVGATQQLSTTLLDARGNTLTGRVVAWSTSDATKATVSNSGLVTGISNGTVAITATSEGRPGSASINVGPEPVATVTVTPPSATIVLGATASFTATAVGLGGAVLTGRSFTWTSSNPAVVSVSSSGNVATATAVSLGTATITATSEGASGTAAVTVTPPPPACPADQALHLAIGETRALTAAQIATTCLGGDTSGSEYVLVPFDASTFVDDIARIQITGTNTSPILSATVASANRRARSSNPVSVGASGVQSPHPSIAAGEIAFKTRERADLASRLNAMRGKARAPLLSRRELLTSVPTAPVVGAVYSLNADVSTSCGPKQLHPARVVAVLPHTIVFVDQTAPAGGYTDAELVAFGTAFDTLGFPLDTLNFGAPTDIDGNGRVGIFFTPGVNVIPAPVGAIVAGLFAVRDLLPTTGADACAGSNEGEIFYMAVPDPSKTLNNAYSDKAFLSSSVAGVLVHEFQHLINSGRRLYVNNAPVAEETWLNEGLSHIAEELLYYRVSGNSPRSNIGGLLVLSTPAQTAAYRNLMSGGDIQRLGTYLFAPEVNSPYSDYDGLETRGATWELLRYAADRKGGAERSTWFALTNSLTAGQANFNAVFGSITDMTHDWAIAQFTDDSGLPTAAQFTYPSWNFRSLYPVDDNFGAWPLASSIHPLPSGTTVNMVLVSGGGGYIRFRVNANVLAVVASTANGSPVPGTVMYTLIRTQ
ncbi:MAG: Ig-like domain-containing protein [Gemmatimonadaceae bacterium]